MQLSQAEGKLKTASMKLQQVLELHATEVETLQLRHSEQVAALEEEVEKERASRTFVETQCRMLTAEVARVQSQASQDSKRLQDDLAKIQAGADADVNALEAEVARITAINLAQSQAADDAAEAHSTALFEAQEAAAEAGRVFEARAAEIALEASVIAEHVSRIGGSGTDQPSSSWGERTPHAAMDTTYWKSPTSPLR